MDVGSTFTVADAWATQTFSSVYRTRHSIWEGDSLGRGYWPSRWEQSFAIALATSGDLQRARFRDVEKYWKRRENIFSAVEQIVDAQHSSAGSIGQEFTELITVDKGWRRDDTMRGLLLNHKRDVTR